MRLDPDQVGPGRGDADRAGAVGADRGRQEPGGHRRRGAAGGAAGGVVEAPGLRVAPNAGPSVKGQRPISGVLVLPTITAPAACSSPRPRGVRGARLESPGQPKAVGSPARSMSSLIAIGTPEQRQALAGAEAALGLDGFGTRRLGAQQPEGVERLLGRFDPLDGGIEQLDRSQLTVGEHLGLPGKPREGDLVISRRAHVDH